MRLSALRPLVVFTLSLLWGVSSGAIPATGQAPSWSTFGIGYVANAPSMLTGAGVYFLLPGPLHGWGLYVDAKFDVSSPAHDPYFLHDSTSLQVQDTVANVEYQYSQNSWQGFNIAVVRPLTPAFMAYVGTGYAKERRYDHFRDPSQTVGQLGLFWAQDTRATKTTMNFMFGGFLRMGRYLTFQTGFETRPVGLTVGGWLKFPPR